jgi:hypothetical protein
MAPLAFTGPSTVKSLTGRRVKPYNEQDCENDPE